MHCRLHFRDHGPGPGPQRWRRPACRAAWLAALLPRPAALLPWIAALLPRVAALLPRLAALLPRPTALLPRPTALLPRPTALLPWLAALPLAALPPAALAQSAYPFKVESIKEGREFRVVAVNGGRAPIDALVLLSESDNVASDTPWPVRRVVQPGQTVELARLYSRDATRTYSFSFRSTWLFGDPRAVHSASATYRLPFEDGRSLVIGQAPGGPLSTHDTPDSADAVDIPMPVGTPIVAARSGYVVENVRPYDTGRLEPDFLDKANYVRIMHDDGTWADYVHLTRYSANLYPGTRIEAGTGIGLSGSSGYSSGPHLHFVVQRNDGGRIVSVPFRFQTVARGAFAPAPDLAVTADYRLPRRDAAAGAPLPAPFPARGPEPRRTARECMGGRNVIDEAVIRCVKGER